VRAGYFHAKKRLVEAELQRLRLERGVAYNKSEPFASLAAEDQAALRARFAEFERREGVARELYGSGKACQRSTNGSRQTIAAMRRYQQQAAYLAATLLRDGL
jgi:hypothetical protein